MATCSARRRCGSFAAHEIVSRPPRRSQGGDQALQKNETITLEDLARLWGVSKARFINIRSDIADFPDPVGKQGNAILYEPRRARAPAAPRNPQRSGDGRPIVEGRADPRRRQGTAMTKTTRCRRRNAGARPRRRRAPTSACASRGAGSVHRRSAGRVEVFGEISSTLSKLSDVVDPNGKLPSHVRDLVDGGGKEVLLRIYNRLNDMLGWNADLDVHPAAANRTRPDRARRTRVRKKRPRRVRARA
jgi:hypothetical protein